VKVPKRLLSVLAVGALVASAAACSSSSSKVTIEWWHISTTDPGKTIFQGYADAYMKAHSNVQINITIISNEEFKTKLATTIQSGKVPDLFQSWGGGVMYSQVDAGMLKDITADVASWKDTINPAALGVYSYNGKQYGIPWDMGMIGFWYNKDLFQQAGITAVPTTWSEYLADVQKLKDAGITPLAIAGKDKWPSMHLWTYLVLRVGGGDALAKMISSGDWNTDACKNAGAEVLKLNALKPYQDGYESATYDNEAAAVGNGKAAMELMGQWAPAVQAADSTDKKGLGDKLGWFPFPSVEGGAGAATDGVGGGNGIAVGKDAPPEAIDFLKFISQLDNAKQIDIKGMGLSPVVGAADGLQDSSITDPATIATNKLLKDVADGLGQAKYMQLYLDQLTSPAVGAAINDSTIALFLGSSTPEQTCQAITTAAQAK
jgi:raffinose/stachyose/melibiose transport system substrate-binding protein